MLQTLLDTLNLGQNQIHKISNISHLTQLTNLCLKNNYLQSVDDLISILDVPSISVLDVQNNRIDDVTALDVFEKMPNLKVLYLQVEWEVFFITLRIHRNRATLWLNKSNSIVRL